VNIEDELNYNAKSKIKSKVPKQKLNGTKLTEVHNSSNPKEQDILFNLHPDEIDIFQLKNSAI